MTSTGFRRQIAPGSTTYTLERGRLRAEVINFPYSRTIMAEVRDPEPAPGFAEGLALWSESFMRPDYSVAQVKAEALIMLDRLAARSISKP
jgi:hypothetical protein